jgi:hypothetical protein
LVSNENYKKIIWEKFLFIYNFHENLGLHPKFSHLNTFLWGWFFYLIILHTHKTKPYIYISNIKFITNLNPCYPS